MNVRRHRRSFPSPAGRAEGTRRISAGGAGLREVLISVSVLLPLFAVEGQDALYNAIALDRTIAAQSNAGFPPQNRPHWGPVQLGAGAYAGVSYNDNISGAQYNPEADMIFREGANLGCDWPATDRSDLRLGTGIGYVHYLKYTANNGVEVNPDSALTYAMSWKDAILTVYDQLSYTRQVTAEAALANVVTLPQFDNTVGTRVEWDPNHWTFQASYGHNLYLSDSAHDYLNRSSEFFYGRAGWRFAQFTQAGLEASGNLTAYQIESQGNTDSYSAGAYLEWKLLQSLNLTLRGGPTFYQSQTHVPAIGNSTLNSYYVSLAVSQQLTDFLSHSLRMDRSVQLGANQGGGYFEQLAIEYSLAWALTRRINLSASLAYDDGQQQLEFFPFLFTEDYQQYSGGLGASWRFTDHLTASLGYSHWVRNSNLPGRNYSANSVSSQLTYTF